MFHFTASLDGHFFARDDVDQQNVECSSAEFDRIDKSSLFGLLFLSLKPSPDAIYLLKQSLLALAHAHSRPYSLLSPEKSQRILHFLKTLLKHRQRHGDHVAIMDEKTTTVLVDIESVVAEIMGHHADDIIQGLVAHSRPGQRADGDGDGDDVALCLVSELLDCCIDAPLMNGQFATWRNTAMSLLANSDNDEARKRGKTVIRHTHTHTK